MEQAVRFFEACAKINMSLDFAYPVEDESQTRNCPTDIYAYERLERNIEIALQKKDDESIQFITEFEKDYMSQYPDHEITKRIIRMIQITSDEQNPNKWKQTYRIINIESLIEVFKTLQQNQQQ